MCWESVRRADTTESGSTRIFETCTNFQRGLCSRSRRTRGIVASGYLSGNLCRASFVAATAVSPAELSTRPRRQLRRSLASTGKTRLRELFELFSTRFPGLLKKNRLKSVTKLNCGAGLPSTPSSLLGCCGLYGFGFAAYVIVVVARCRIGASLAPGLPLQRGAPAFLTVVFVVRICIFEPDGGRAPHTVAALFSL